jgi:hypothetical protein
MSSGPTSRLSPPSTRGLLIRTILGTLALFLALQIWRPYYYLTDDNLSVGLPFLTEMGRHLKSGQSPFYSDYLYGGHYNLLRDANYFSWSPINFIVSLLSDTFAKFAMLDIIALVNVLLSTTGFALLAAAVRDELGLELGNGRIIFLTLSFGFSTFILTTGASWVNFLANQAVLPWLALGLWQTTWRRALGLLVLFSLHQALSGQSAGTISNGLILTLFAILMCVYRRNARPLLTWIVANVLTLVIIAPILLPAMAGFFHSHRGEGISVDLLHKFAMPAGLIPISFLFGNFFEMAAYLEQIQSPSFFLFPRMPTLLACAAAWCIFPLVCQRRRWTQLEIGLAVLIAVIAVLVIRPIEITKFMSHVPILRSMRWPFREILQLLFFFHLLLAIRPWAGTPRMQNRLACISLGFFVLPLCYTAPLTLNGLTEDRVILFSGMGDRYWAAFKPYLRPGDSIATVIDPNVWYYSMSKVPYTLIGSADFPAYYRVRCISGYSQTPPVDQLPIPVIPYYWFGAYSTAQVPLITKNHPEVRIITVQSFTPLHMTLSPATPGDQPIDLFRLLGQ